MNFIKKIEYSTNFASTETCQVVLLQLAKTVNQAIFFIHRVWRNPTFYNSFFSSIENVIFKHSYITKLGEIDDKKNVITGKALHKMMVGYNLKKGPFLCIQ